MKIDLTSQIPKQSWGSTSSLQITLCKTLFQMKPFRNSSYIQINFSIHSETKYFAK